MANKPTKQNWNDIQIAITSISMVLTLAFWNLFAGPDREASAKRAQEQATQAQPKPEQIVETQVAPQVMPQMDGPIYFGGSAPQTIVQNPGRGGGGGGGTGGS